MLEGNPRRHYCLLKRVNEKDDEIRKLKTAEEREAEVKYRRIKQELKIKDLLRYGIKAILVDEYQNITEIIQLIREKFLSNNIFISGAYSELSKSEVLFSVNDNIEEASEKLCEQIGISLYENGYKIVNCLGQGVGRAVVTGVLNKLYEQKKGELGDTVTIKPFPNTKDENLKKKYRTEILSQCGLAIFLFGNKMESDKITYSSGVLEEYRIARDMGLHIIPVGVTGYAARQIWYKVKEENETNARYDKRYMELFEKLNQENTSIEEITNTIIEMIAISRDRITKAKISL